MSTTGEARRRAEIEAKRTKLAELRRAREERSSRLQAGRAGDGGKSVSEATTPSSRKDIDDFVAHLVGSGGAASTSGSRRGGSATPSSPQPKVLGIGGANSSIDATTGAATGSSEYAASDRSGTGPASAGTMMVNRADGEEQGITRPGLVDSEAQTEVAELPRMEKVYYTKETQTAPAPDDMDDGVSGRAQDDHVSAAVEESIRQKILNEQERERLKQEEAALKSQEEQLEREIEQGLRELTSDELNVIYGASEFVDFVEQSSKIVERALTDSYDFMKDYTSTMDRLDDQSEGRQIKMHRVFWDETLCKGRSITDLDWSTKHPELAVASYSRSDAVSSDDPDGLVLVWNLHLSDRPEFIFHAQTDVLSVSFSPFHPNLVIGGTYSGQVLIWDTRARQLPVLKTPLSASGHTHPIYSIRIVGTQNANNLITASTDGTVCSWMLDMLARPQETVELLNPSHPKTDEISATVVGFPDQETTSFLVGTEDGNVYAATRYDRAGWKAGIDLSEVYCGHAAPVTGLHFHPLRGPVDFSDLFLTSSMDWTSRLWQLRNASSFTSAAAAAAAANSSSAASSSRPGTGPTVIRSLLTIEEASDYVYDVAWHTAHPALFAQVDGTGRIDIFNLNVDAERPVASVSEGTSRALNKIRWDRREGKRFATGGADGRVYVYDVGTMAVPREDEWVEMQKSLARLKNVASNGTTSAAISAGAMSNGAPSGSASSAHASGIDGHRANAVSSLDHSQRIAAR